MILCERNDSDKIAYRLRFVYFTWFTIRFRVSHSFAMEYEKSVERDRKKNSRQILSYALIDVIWFPPPHSTLIPVRHRSFRRLASFQMSIYFIYLCICGFKINTIKSNWRQHDNGVAFFASAFFFLSFFRRSTTLSFVWQYSTPTKWHFAAHMGQLMRDTIDSFGRAAGCSELWPQCPFSSQILMQLNSKKQYRT